MKNGRLWDKLDAITDRALDPHGAESHPAQHLSRPKRRIRGAAGLIAALNEPENNVRAHIVRRDQGTAKADLLRTAGGNCEACSFAPPEASILHLHHVIPVHLGGTNAPENTILLCPNCHAVAHWMLRTYDNQPADRRALLLAFDERQDKRASA